MKKTKVYDGSSKLHYKRYRQWQYTDESEYLGLSEKDKEWLRKFNREYVDEFFEKDPLHKMEQRKTLYRECYKQRFDAANIAHGGIENAAFDPTDKLIKILDGLKTLGINKSGLPYRRRLLGLPENGGGKLTNPKKLTELERRHRIFSNLAKAVDAMNFQGVQTARGIIEIADFLELELSALASQIGRLKLDGGAKGV